MPAKNLYRERKKGIYSHVYNKGVEKRVIFNDEEDYATFQGYLKEYLTPPQDPKSIKKSFTVKGRIFHGTPHLPKNYFGKVELVAYALMPGHFHLLLRQVTQGSLETFLRSLCTRYSMYFNKKYKHTGALFQGPYKSAQVTDGPRLPHLTRYFHYDGGYSSYSEYIGKRKASWIKPEAVLAFFSKGAAGYKEFVEKYKPDAKIAKLLEGITFETESQHLERREPARGNDNQPQNEPEQFAGEKEEKFDSTNLKPLLKPLQRVPEFVAAAIIFLMLLTSGLRNVLISTAKSLDSKIDSAVLATKEEAKPEITPSATPSPVFSVTPTAPPTAYPIVNQIAPKSTLTVKLDDINAKANIRENPTVNSRKIVEAKNGATFEYLSKNSGWYEIRLADGSTGFISETLVVVNGGSN